MNESKYISDLYLAGSTIAEIGAMVGCSNETVRRRLITLGVSRRPRGQPVGKHLPSGGRVVDKSGYILVRAREHPQANSSGYVREHRLIMEKVMARFLLPDEVVHHRNGIKADNRPENLQVFESNAAHKRHDMLGNHWATGDVNNPKRSRRTRRTPEEILVALRALAGTLERPIRRADLVPPNPSYRAVARAHGSWRLGVSFATAGDTY